jgi:hypothetical protein
VAATALDLEPGYAKTRFFLIRISKHLWQMHALSTAVALM